MVAGLEIGALGGAGRVTVAGIGVGGLQVIAGAARQGNRGDQVIVGFEHQFIARDPAQHAVEGLRGAVVVGSAATTGKRRSSAAAGEAPTASGEGETDDLTGSTGSGQQQNRAGRS